MKNLEIRENELLPRIWIDYKHDIYKGDNGRHIQEAYFEELTAQAQPRIEIAMLEDIGINFGQLEGDRFRFVLERDRLGKVEWADRLLIHHSFLNLFHQYGESIKILGQPDAAMRIEVGNDLEASFLLMGNLWEKIAAEFGAQICAAIPRQDLLLFTAQDNQKGILQLQKAVKEVFKAEDSGTLLSKAIYQRFDGEWKIVAAAF